MTFTSIYFYKRKEQINLFNIKLILALKLKFYYSTAKLQNKSVGKCATICIAPIFF